MSDIGIYKTEILSIHNHPYADRLEIAKIMGTQTIVRKGEFEAGETVIYFPPDMMLPEDVIDNLGVRNYLRHARYDNVTKTQCRIAAARIRSIPSYGFIIKNTENNPDETDLTEKYKAKKYSPPTKFTCGDAMPEKTGFSSYTSIQHYWRFEDVFKEAVKDTDIFITEKIHGTNFRLGKIDGELCVGSHHVRRKVDKAGIYDVPMQDDKLMKLLDDVDNMIFYGEIYGLGVQDLDYGTLPSYAIFDILYNGQFLAPLATLQVCSKFGIPHVPVLYVGPFSQNVIDDFTNGPSHLRRSKHFDGREGIVIKPVVPMYHGTLGRVILKSVSADYYARKEQDYEMILDHGEKYNDSKNG